MAGGRADDLVGVRRLPCSGSLLRYSLRKGESGGKGREEDEARSGDLYGKRQRVRTERGR